MAEVIATRETVADAFVAKSVSDQLVMVDIAAADGDAEEPLPATVRERLEDADVRPADQVYGDEEAAGSPEGPIEDGTRHHFVDVRTRGTHRTEVVE